MDDPAELVGKPLHFLVKIKRATGLPRTAAQAGFIDRPTTADVNERPGTGQVTATLRVRYHCAGLGAGWGAVHATPPVPVVAVNESRGSAMFRGFRSATGGAGGSGSTMGGASATLRYERPHACPTVTAAILAELEGGKIVFDVYLQQDGGAGAEAASASAAAAALGRRRRMAREIEPPSLVTGRNRAFDGGGGDDDDRAVGVLSEELCEGSGLGVGTGREGGRGGRGIGFGRVRPELRGGRRGRRGRRIRRGRVHGGRVHGGGVSRRRGILGRRNVLPVRRGSVSRILRRRRVRRRGRRQAPAQGNHQRGVPADVPESAKGHRGFP